MTVAAVVGRPWPSRSRHRTIRLRTSVQITGVIEMIASTVIAFAIAAFPAVIFLAGLLIVGVIVASIADAEPGGLVPRTQPGN